MIFRVGDNLNSSVKGRPTIEDERLRQMSGIVAKVEWVLFGLVATSLGFAGIDTEERSAILTALYFYGAAVLTIRFGRILDTRLHRKVLLEIALMIVLVTWVTWFTDRLASPLTNAYLIIVVISALTLDVRSNIAQLVLIAACYMLLGEGFSLDMLRSPRFVLSQVAQIAPLALLSYTVLKFSAELRHEIRKRNPTSDTDAVTGMCNWHGFAMAADQLFAHMSRSAYALSAVRIRIDGLSQIVEHDGKASANCLVMHVAQCLRKALRHSDLAARCSEDEFIVLLSETPHDGAAELVERFLAEDAAARPVFDGKSPPWELSVGVSSGTKHGIDALLARASRAMSPATKTVVEPVRP